MLIADDEPPGVATGAGVGVGEGEGDGDE